MTDTLPFATNRIAPHFQTPEPQLPKSARERGKLWSDTVFQAVLALKAQLRNPDATVVMAAANAILEMERTRMRHAKNLAGSESVSEAQEEFEAEERRAAESQFARRTAHATVESAKPKPDSAVTPSLADHAREARRVFHETGEMTVEESLQFTEGFLECLGRDAGDVSKEEFRATLREMSAKLERERVAA